MNSILPTPSNSGIQQVIIHKPDAEEIATLRPSRWWAVPRWLSSIPGRIWNTISFIRQRNLRPFFERAIDGAAYFSNWNDCFRTRNITKNVQIMNAIFSYPRLEPTEKEKNKTEKDPLTKMLEQIFPEHKFGSEDVILCCTAATAVKFREVLHHSLNPSSIANHTSHIQAIVINYINGWAKLGTGTINITHETRKFAANIIGHVVLNGKGSYDDVAISLNYLNEFMAGKFIRFFSKSEDERRYKQALTLLRASLLEIYNNPEADNFISQLKANRELDETQKLGLIFFLFIAGQETTASLLNYIIWQLALNPKYQEAIYSEIAAQKKNGVPLDKIAANMDTVRKIFKEGIRLFTPAYGIARVADQDLIVEMRMTNGSVEKKYINKGEAMTVLPTFAGRDSHVYGADAHQFKPERHQTNDLQLPWLPFGAGSHVCPGQWLAREEIKQFLVYLIDRFEFSTDISEEAVLQKGLLTLQLSQDIFVKLKARA